MSAYYYTGMRPVFVLVLFALGVFLICSCRHSHNGSSGNTFWSNENAVTNVAGSLAIVVATFPTAPLEIADLTAFQWFRYKLLHLGSALTFLSLTGWIAWRFFAKRDPARARTYRLLAGGIWVTLGLGIVTRMFLQGQDGMPDLITNHGVWVVEFVTVTLFGIAWWISARDPTPSGTTEAS